MSDRCFAALVVAAAIVVVGPIEAAGQAAVPTSDGWTVPRTADGQPDLQGVWASDSATPLERPEQLADKAFLTDEELATLQARAAVLFNGETDAAFGDSVFRAVLEDAPDFSSRDTETGNYNQFWLIDRWFDNRTSMIVDPADGRIPPLTPEAQERRQESAQARRPRDEPPSGPEDLGGMRCLGGGVPMTGRGYNSNYQIVQSPGHVAILMEMQHDTRIIPLDGRPHLPTTVRSALGDSRGHWEGDTLVVETTNLATRSRRNGASSNLHLVERFTRVDQDTLQYEYTMNDPTTWTRPWTARVFMRPAPGTGVIYEFACHEGNYAVPNTLSGARAQERAAEHAAKE